MNSKAVLSLEDVKKMLAAAESYAIAQHFDVTIAVADDGGHLLGLLRLDGAAPLSAQIAPGKAQTAALGRKESKVFEDSINGGRFAFLSAPLTAILEGGVPIVVDGQVVGAVGVSGAKASEDVQVARAGIAALGL